MDKQTPKIFKVSGYLLDPTGRLNRNTRTLPRNIGLS